jgi:hypothetical protein
MSPFVKLPRRLRPVSTAIMMIIRPCFKLPSAGSMATRKEFLETDCASAFSGLSKGARLETCGETRSGAGKASL